VRAGQPRLPDATTPASAARYADVAVPLPPAVSGRPTAIGKTWRDQVFTYAIPADLRGSVQPGHIVAVPFGSRQLRGVVIALRPESNVERTRPITSVADRAPALTAEQITLSQHMSEHYLAPLFECLQAMLPPGALAQAQVVYQRTAQSVLPGTLGEAEMAALGAFGRQRELGAAQVRSRTRRRDTATALESLVTLGVLTVSTRPAGPRVRARSEQVVRSAVDDPSEREMRLLAIRAHSGADAVACLRREPHGSSRTVDELLEASGARIADLRRLAVDGLIELREGERRIATDLTPAGAETAAREELGRAPAQARLLRALAAAGGSLPRDEALRESAASPAALRGLTARGLAREESRPGSVTLLTRGVHALAAEVRLRRLERHAAALSYLAAAGGTATVREVRRSAGATPAALRDLEEAGLVTLGDRRVWRDPLGGRAVEPTVAPAPTPDQEAAWRVIEPLLAARYPPGSMSGTTVLPAGAAGRTCLVHGVTGSGKTELYLRAIQHTLDAGNQAIVLVPEISQTPQTVSRIAGRFPGRVGVWHSELSEGERHDTWQRVRDGAIDVVVGSRSAVFAPLPRLALIVVDEEHSDAYKQERTPRYHARDVAMRRAALCGGAALLASATPSVETYWSAKRGEIALAEMPRRVVAEATGFTYAELPPVEVVDMRAELRSGNTSILSRSLHEALAEALDAGEQAILFMNRRGSATFVSCRDCGHVESCPRCAAPLTYHGRGKVLVCHHCNSRRAPPMMCPQCGSPRIKYFGAGTQRIEHVVGQRFPGARLLRWDADTTGRKGAHDALLAQFAGGEADVLIGTQMVAKGLDLPRVTLVGVVSSDTSLYLPDIRSRERTFQLLSQVAGRAGRSALGGRVVFQTYTPNDPAIQRAAEHDFTGFFADEITYRMEQGYPPFRTLVRLEYLSASENAAAREAERLARSLRLRIDQLGLDETHVVGPAPAFFGRVRGKSRWHVIVASRSAHELLAEVEVPRGWRVDVDPVSVL